MRFYSYPLNYHNNRSSPVEVADNRYDTFTTSTGIVCYIDSEGDGSGDAVEFTDLFIKGKNITDLSVVVAGGTTTGFGTILPATVENDSGEDVSTTIDGLQNFLITGLGVNTGKTLTLTFTGSGLQVHEVMILRELLRIEGGSIFVDPQFTYHDLGTVKTSANGRLSYSPALNNERDKWSVNSRVELNRFNQGDIRGKMDELLILMRNHKQFTFAPEINRYPEMIAPALFPDRERQIRYLNRNKQNGRAIQLTIREL